MSDSQARDTRWSSAEPPDPEREEQIRELGLELRDFFARRFLLTPVKVLGGGAYGVAYLFNQLDLDREFVRQLVVKAALSLEDPSVVHEAQVLANLRPAEHIMRLIRSVPPERHAGFALSRFAIITEYVEHGSWNEIVKRYYRARSYMPNRILWGVFLCLTRAIIAMAYPPLIGSVHDPTWRETIPEGDVSPCTLAHDDMHLGNVLVGRWDFRDSEHRLSPITKLIDFGSATELPFDKEFGDYTGIHANIDSIGRVMLLLAIGHYDYDYHFKQVRRYPGGALHTIATLSHDDLDKGHISDELKFLIRRCRAIDPLERPSLEELLEVCENAVQTHTSNTYAGLYPGAKNYETIQYLYDWIQRFILNGPLDQLGYT